jgi:hypothetical protein
MAKHECYLCGMEVGWGTTVCPRCGSALEWQETDEDDPIAHLMPPYANGYDTPKPPRPWYPVGALVAGVILLAVGIAAGMQPGMLIIGALLAVGGGIGLAAYFQRRD